MPRSLHTFFYPLSTLRQLSKQAPFVQLQDVALTKTALKQTKEANLTFLSSQGVSSKSSGKMIVAPNLCFLS